MCTLLDYFANRNKIYFNLHFYFTILFMRITTFLFGITILISILFFSCERANIHLDDAGFFLKDTSGNLIVDTVHFTSQILPIFQNNCGSCHFAGTTPDFKSPNMYNNLVGGNYLNLANPENSNLFYLPDPGHADDYLNTQEHLLIVKWIGQGALNN